MKPLSLGLPAISSLFALGMVLIHFPALLPNAAWPLAGLSLALGLPRLWPQSKFLSFFAPLALGFTWIWLHAAWQLQAQIPVTLEGRDLILTGVIADLPQVRSSGTKFLFTLESTHEREHAVDLRGQVILNQLGKSALVLRAGERWRLLARLKAPHGFANPGGYDAEAKLFRDGIIATGYVRESADNVRLAAVWGLAAIRQQLRDQLTRLAPANSIGIQIIIALILGDGSGLDTSLWDTFTRTGTSHLIVVSGMNVGLLAASLFWFTYYLWRLSATLCLLFAAKRAAALAGLTGAWIVAALAGFDISVQRAFIAALVWLGSILLLRPIRFAHGFFLALLLVLLYDPLSSLSPGFWLSFGGAGLLIYGLQARLQATRHLSQLLRMQWIISIGLLPLLLLWFGRDSVIGAPVNLVIAPIFETLFPAVFASTVIGLTTGYTLPLDLFIRLIEAGLNGLQTLAAQPWAIWHLPHPPFWMWPLAFGGVTLLLAPRGLPGRWMGALWLLPLILYRPALLTPGVFQLTVLDVGQGLAAVVRTRHHVLVYDTGPGISGGWNSGAALLTPFLYAEGIDHIDRLIVSHGDNDHAGGVSGLLRYFPATVIESGEPDALPISAAQCQAGQSWDWDGVTFAILHPSPPWPRSANDRSCILRISTTAGAALLSGDASMRVERALVAALPAEALRAQVLIAGHHGSASSSAAEWLHAVQPQWVVFSAGYRNRYRFPRRAVLQRVADVGASSINTAETGALKWQFGPGIRLDGPERYRMQHGQVWTQRPGGETP